MIVTEAERVDEAVDIIKKECGHHQKITINMPYVSGSSMVHCATMPMSVDVGGATIFVVDVERYEKIWYQTGNNHGKCCSNIIPEREDSTAKL